MEVHVGKMIEVRPYLSQRRSDLCLAIPLAIRYVRGGFLLNDLGGLAGHVAMTGLLLLIFGFMTFTFTLVLHAAALSARTAILANLREAANVSHRPGDG